MVGKEGGREWKSEHHLRRVGWVWVGCGLGVGWVWVGCGLGGWVVGCLGGWVFGWLGVWEERRGVTKYGKFSHFD